jgi:isocitrate dehydrogenase kinase/phosphatase
VIKDRFDSPKDTTRQAVMDHYQLVFKHDRAGRLVDAQEFEYLIRAQLRVDAQIVQLRGAGHQRLKQGGRNTTATTDIDTLARMDKRERSS